MDCSICSSLPVILRPPRNTICGSCYDGAKCLINLINKLENDQKMLNKPATVNNVSAVTPPTSTCKFKIQITEKSRSVHLLVLADFQDIETKLTRSILIFNLLLQTLTNASKWIIHFKNREEELEQKINFLSEFITAFTHRIHTDIHLKPGDAASPSIPAHRALLAVRSEIFKNLLESDGCKAAPMEAITLPELNHEELESLVEFLYGGDLGEEKLEKHVYSLSMAADKYEIAYLRKLCERFMMKRLSCSNALEVVEIADVCSFVAVKESAVSFIIKHMEEVVFSAGYEAFALKNPHLSLHITRASLMDAKKNRSNSVV